ncbi:MFS transporter [Lacrimispora sp. 210928-DFI.3.58]|uniref:MFS transporter n=1 Tax=Lacrimispora sp. 210928-DFI.3.58 TaxID=2883214 RepID=UPI001D0601FE|nr:MFS transporter [Lacrimispora sp. 210928-DFI.3.58]MCB7320818.1 MFS transporter [Lacrimispora sp. 210928-DFI.3.58]
MDSTVFITIAACLTYGISAGIRANYGILLGPISESSGAGYSSVSFVLAVAQLFFGIMQPVFGVAALKKSNPFVLRSGIALTTAGLLLLPLCRSMWTLMLVLGIILPSGTAALSFGIIMGTITPKLSPDAAPAVSGVVTASSGVGSTILSPVIQALTALGGLTGAALFLGIPALLLLPVSIFMCRPGAAKQQIADAGQHDVRLGQMLKEALQDKNYWFLLAGFFTCGFHMAIIETHLYTQITTFGFTDQVAAFAFSAYGIATMAGAVVSGMLCSRFSMKKVLSGIYAFRVLMVPAFLFLPKTLVTIYGFAILLGLTGNATVPPTSGITERLFGAAKLATLFGIVFFSHQIGSFLSAWLGGICLAATGEYGLIWIADMMLAAMAAAVSWKIK